MLAGLVGLLVAAGPLLSGARDLWAQTLLLSALSAGFGAWLCARVLIGYVPVPSARVHWWVGGLAVLGSLSAHLSPLSVYAVPAWRVWLAALWIFPAMTVLSKDLRSGIDEAVRLAAWVLMLLAFYQHFRMGVARPAASFFNQNIFAGTILLLLPLAVSKRDWLLTAGLLWALWWTRSVGAWLGLSAALVYTRRHGGAAGFWTGLGIGAVCLVAIYGKFQTPEVLDRVRWWTAAARMAWERPILGWGSESFAHILPAYRGLGEYASLFAHQDFLQLSAECGLAFSLLWLAGIVHCLRVGGPHKSFGAAAILVHSLWDYPLSIPGNLWLFCYFCASAVSESHEGVNIPSRYKLPACLLILGLVLGCGGLLSGQWRAERARSTALESLRAGGLPAEAAARLAAEPLASDDPDAARLKAEAELRGLGLGASAPGRALSAAALLERSASANPYRATTWLMLSDLYGSLGRAELALAKRGEGARTCPPLRAGGPP